jgi:dihydroxyacid dehydratase/phosphogluconate dehydratase
MGWPSDKVAGGDYLILSTQGGIRQPDGKPIALGYHTGHFEVGLLMEEVAKTITSLGGVPFAGFVSDPCDGRTQGTDGMMDSLPYRNDASMVFRRLIRSHPTRKGVVGVATCDKGLPAMMMALAAMHDLPTVLVPGGVTLLSEDTDEDLGRIQTIGARYAQGTLSYADAAEAGCKACASPGGGCQFLGTAATSQVIGEALGLTLPHSALAPSGADIWRDMARRRTSSRKPRSRMPSPFTPPSADRPTSSCTCPRSPTRRECVVPTWTTGAGSTPGCRASLMPCRTDPSTTPPSRSSSPAACPR